MTSAFQDVLEKLRELRDPVQPSIQAFPPLELEQLTEELKVRARGEESGRRERPSSDATSPDSTELDILSEIERRARKGSEEYRTQLMLYEGRIRRAVITADQRVMIEAAGQSALADFVAQIRDDLNHLHNDREETEGRARELRDFQKANGLARPARIVEPRDRLYRGLFLCTLVLIESIMNGFFFAKGSTAGMIGGVSQALVLSMLNVGGAVLYVLYGLPQLHHVRLQRRILGVMATLAFIAWALGLNLAIAHFRDLFVSHEGQVAMEVLAQRLFEAPFHLTDAQSWLLVLMGLGLCILALIDAMGLDDPYPGYGELGRRYHEGNSRLAEHTSLCLAALQARRDEAERDMTAVIEAMRNSEYELRLAIEGRERLHYNYVGYLDHLANAFERLVLRYREANQSVRTTLEPAFFHGRITRPAFLGGGVPLAPLPDITTDARAVVIERMEFYIREVNAAVQSALGQYQSVGDLTRETRIAVA
jgi:hypothetical protein